MAYHNVSLHITETRLIKEKVFRKQNRPPQITEVDGLFIMNTHHTGHKIGMLKTFIPLSQCSSGLFSLLMTGSSKNADTSSMMPLNIVI